MLAGQPGRLTESPNQQRFQFTGSLAAGLDLDRVLTLVLACVDPGAQLHQHARREAHALAVARRHVQRRATILQRAGERASRQHTELGTRHIAAVQQTRHCGGPRGVKCRIGLISMSGA